MLFNTVSYFFFLAICVANFGVLPQSKRSWLILAARSISHALCAWNSFF